MHIRFVRVRIKKGRHDDFARFYSDQVIPALEETRGCLFASLLQPTDAFEEFVSLTLWKSQRHAEAYETSGRFDELLDLSDDYLAEVVTWRVGAKGETEGKVTRLQDPEVELYPVQLATDSWDLAETASRFYVRTVEVDVEPGRFPELRERFNSEIVPALLETTGCRGVFLVESTDARSRALSVTIWNSESDAIRYEASGVFDDLTSRVSEFFSGLYRWRLSLAPNRSADDVHGSDLEVRGYRVITGKRLRT
jgi:heme-degrading monooxygenase HmoA